MLQYSHSLGLLWNKSILKIWLYTNILDDTQTIHALPFAQGPSVNVWSCWVLPLLYRLRFQFCYTLIYINFPGLSRSLPDTEPPPPPPPSSGFRMICFYLGRRGGGRAWDSLQMWALQRLAFPHNSKGILVLWPFPLVHSLILYHITHPWPSLALHNHYSWFATTWQGGHMHVGGQISRNFFLKKCQWKWSLVPGGEKCFCSWPSTWPPWRHVHTSNFALKKWGNLYLRTFYMDSLFLRSWKFFTVSFY